MAASDKHGIKKKLITNKTHSRMCVYVCVCARNNRFVARSRNIPNNAMEKVMHIEA